MSISTVCQPVRSLWSASPTPLQPDLSLDENAVARMVEQHVRLGCDGVFLAGTCGEGPWMTREQIHRLLDLSLQAAAGRLDFTVQVTENSSPRVLLEIERIAPSGVGSVIVAQPAQFMNATPARVLSYYLEILDESPLPVCFYNRGSRPDFPIDESVLLEIYAHPRLVMVKDSSFEPAHNRAAVQARNERPDLKILGGDEFRTIHYLDIGYDGFMFGGAVLTAGLLRKLMREYDAGQLDQARLTDELHKDILLTAYGGKDVSCWLSGLKQTLCRLGVFDSAASHLQYPFTEECEIAIDQLIASQRDCLTGTRSQESVAA